MKLGIAKISWNRWSRIEHGERMWKHIDQSQKTGDGETTNSLVVRKWIVRSLRAGLAELTQSSSNQPHQ